MPEPFFFSQEFKSNPDWKDFIKRVTESFKEYGFVFEDSKDTTYKVNNIPVYFESRGATSRALVFYMNSKEIHPALKQQLEQDVLPAFFSVKAFVDYYNENGLGLFTKKFKNIHGFGTFDF